MSSLMGRRLKDSGGGTSLTAVINVGVFDYSIT